MLNTTAEHLSVGISAIYLDFNMSLCKYCGADIKDDKEICLYCRRMIEILKKETQTVKINGFDITDVKKNRSIACLSYLPLLFIIPLIICPKSKYAIYHAAYGFRLSILGMIFIIAGFIIKLAFNNISMIFEIILMSVYFLLLIIGVYCAYNCITIKNPLVKKKKNN